MQFRKFRYAMLALGATLVCAGPSMQSYPAKPIDLVVGLAPAARRILLPGCSLGRLRRFGRSPFGS